ncbi:MAG TPA: MFS transporter [Candidatus Methanoperedens sp.]|nr:MFS transporter [Candidatus Methanoperedens sp.]
MSDIAYKQGLARNIKIYYLQRLLLGLEFFLPVWVAFELKFTDFAGLAILETVHSLVVVFTELPTGAFADIFGRRKSIILGMFSTAFLYFIFPFSPSFVFMCFIFALWGLADTFISGADSALLYDSLKDIDREGEYAKVSSKGALIYRMAIAFGTLVGGSLYLFWNPAPFLLYGVGYLIAAISALFLTEPKIDSEKISLSNYLSQTTRGVKEAFKNFYVSCLSIYYIIIGAFSWAATYYFSNIYAQQNGFGPREQSILFSIIYFIKSIFAVFIAHSEHLFNRKKIYTTLFIFSVLSFLPAHFVKGSWIIAIIFATEFVSSLRFTLLDKYVNQEYSSKNRATALSFLSLVISLIYVLVVYSTKDISNTMGVGAIYSVLGLICLLILTPTTYFLIKNHH